MEKNVLFSFSNKIPRSAHCQGSKIGERVFRLLGNISLKFSARSVSRPIDKYTDNYFIFEISCTCLLSCTYPLGPVGYMNCRRGYRIS